MQRSDFLRWLERHPESVHCDPGDLCERCERAVRDHAAEEAWRHARDIVSRLRDMFEGDWGFHASEAFVARELCHRLARELQRHEPHPRPGDEERMVDPRLLAALEPEAREQLRSWVHELAEAEEHREWQEILRFTDRCASRLEREGRVSTDLTWEGTHSYAEAAAKVADLLVREYDRRMAAHA